MITFEQVCSQFGLEPKAVREIIKGDYDIRVCSMRAGDDEKAYQMEKLVNWYMDYLAKPKNEWCECEKPYHFIYNPSHCDNCGKPVKPKKIEKLLPRKACSREYVFKINEIIDHLNREGE